MSDRCYVSVHCRARDAGQICEYLGIQNDFEDEPPNLVVEITDEETSKPVDELPLVPHWGFHGEGYEYDCGVFACDGKVRAYADSAIGTDVPVVRVNDRGKLEKSGLAAARAYWRLYHRVHEMLRLPDGELRRLARERRRRA